MTTFTFLGPLIGNRRNACSSNLGTHKGFVKFDAQDNGKSTCQARFDCTFRLFDMVVCRSFVRERLWLLCDEVSDELKIGRKRIEIMADLHSIGLAAAS